MQVNDMTIKTEICVDIQNNSNREKSIKDVRSGV